MEGYVLRFPDMFIRAAVVFFFGDNLRQKVQNSLHKYLLQGAVLLKFHVLKISTSTEINMLSDST